MTGHRLLTAAEGRLRVAPWRGDGTVAYVTPGRRRPDSSNVERCIAELTEQGYRSALTNALSVEDQPPFLAAGFVVHERLHLLTRTLDGVPPPSLSDVTLRRGRQGDRPVVLAVDESAFPPFWQLSSAGLDDALSATPSSRLRVALAEPHHDVIGYAVTGRAGPRGYLQRLAVHPGAQRGGVGTALVLDGLRWLKRWGGREVLVNTQEGNDPAVELYRRLGFHLRREGLAVLRWALPEDR